MLVCAQNGRNSDGYRVIFMANVEWQFRQMSRAEINQESMEREFFQEEPINVRFGSGSCFRTHWTQLWIRPEDSPGVSSGPVRVRFSLSGISNPLSEELAHIYFEGIEPHLRVIAGLDDDIIYRLKQGSLVSGGVPFMVVEDDRTTGLNGDWEQFR